MARSVESSAAGTFRAGQRRARLDVRTGKGEEAGLPVDADFAEFLRASRDGRNPLKGWGLAGSRTATARLIRADPPRFVGYARPWRRL